MADHDIGVRGAVARRVADETGRCPECGAVAERVAFANDPETVGAFFNHDPSCAALVGIAWKDGEALATELKPIDDELLDWERKLL